MPALTERDKLTMTTLLVVTAVLEGGCVALVVYPGTSALLGLHWFGASPVVSRGLLAGALATSSGVNLLAVSLFRTRYFAALSQGTNPALYITRMVWAFCTFPPLVAAHVTDLRAALGFFLMYLSLVFDHYPAAANRSPGLTGEFSRPDRGGLLASTNVGTVGACVVGVHAASAGTGVQLAMATTKLVTSVVDVLFALFASCTTSRTALGMEYVHTLLNLGSRVAVSILSRL